VILLYPDGKWINYFCSWRLYGQSEAHLRKDRSFEEHATCSKNNHNQTSVSLLCWDDYKLVFEPNKFVMSKFGNFMGKDYVRGGMFRLSTSNYSYNLNVVSMINNKMCEANVWHSRFCHIRFDTIARMSRLEIISKFNIVKGSNCQSYVQAKQS
jgi:hypothetical protein